MKRSEMLTIIRATLRNYGVEPCPNEHDDVAEDILNIIEEKGMEPPKAMVHHSPYPKGHKFYGPNKTLENKWEEE